MDEDPLIQFDDIDKSFRDIIHYRAMTVWPGICSNQNGVMEYCTAATMQIYLWNPFFRNVWKEESKHTFAATVVLFPKLYKTCEMNGCSYTIRLKLIKIAARTVCVARYITFKLCSSCLYKKEFYRTLENIQQLTVQLE